MVFLGVMDEAMSSLQAVEVTAITASSSTRRPKHRHDCVTSHFKLRHDYFDDYCACC
jgi:hypothetical protein